MTNVAKTRIEWTDESWNPVTGCTKVSQGCKNCYAEKVFPRAYSKDQWPNGDGTFRPRRFTDVECHPKRLEQPLHWRKPRRVFVNSMSDLFHGDVPDDFIDQVFAVMALVPQHTFQVLTKRPERMTDYFRGEQLRERIDAFKWAVIEEHVDPSSRRRDDIRATAADICGADWPLSNVWHGVSVEDQETADERIPLLLQTPAAVRFVSYEPATGPVNFKNWLWRGGSSLADDPLARAMLYQAEEAGQAWLCDALDWIIVGGESGPGARPFDIQWARDTIAQCKAAGVPVFVKQLGARPFEEGCEPGHVWLGQNPQSLCKVTNRKGADIAEWPHDLWVRELPP